MSQTVRTFFALAAMMPFACAISYFFLIHQSLRLDESQSLWQTAHTPLSILTVVAADVHVPLYHELLHFWRLFVGDSVTSSRVLSLVFFLASIPAIYFFGKQAYSRKVGLWAALLLSVSPFMNWYGNEIRMYTLFMLMVVLNQYFFMQIWKAPKRDTWFWYVVTAVLGVFSHYLFFLSLAAQAVFFLLRPKLFPKGSFKKFIVSAVVVAVFFAPWIFYVLHINQIQNQTPLIATPTTVDLFGAFQQFVFGFQDTAISTIILSLWPIALVFGFLALQRHNKMRSETEYLLLAAFIPVLLAYGVSFAITPIFLSRYLISAIPALYLCILVLFESFPKKTALFCKIALVLLMLITLGIEIGSAYTPVKENYLGVSTYLTSHVRPQDVVLISAPFTIYPIEYYYKGTAPISTLPVWNQYAYGSIPAFSEATLPEQVASSTADAQDVWLVLSYDQGYQKDIKDYFDAHYKLLFTKIFSPALTLYVYQLRYDTPISYATSHLPHA
jgi:uncharacterized membrane protein